MIKKFIVFLFLSLFLVGGFGMNTSLGGSTDKGKASLAPQGSTTISMKDKGSESEQVTRATIGMGNITVGGNELAGEDPALAGLNRNTDNAQEIARDMITGALDGSVTVDNRIFSPSGWKQIAKQHEDLGENAAKAALGATGLLANTGRVIYDAATTGEVDETVDNWKAGQTKIVDIVNVGTTGRNTLNNLSEGQDVNDIQDAVNGGAKIYYDENDKNPGFYDVNNRDNTDINGVYLNAAQGTATNTSQFMNTWGHEGAHPYTDSENVATSVGGFTDSMWGWSNALNFTSTNTDGSTTSQDWAYQQMVNTNSGTTLVNNTYQAQSVKPEDRRNTDPLTIAVVTAVALTGGMMAHQETLNPMEALDKTAKDLKQGNSDLRDILWDKYPEAMDAIDDGIDTVNREIMAPFTPSLEAIGQAVNSGLDLAADGLQAGTTALTGNENWLDENYLTRDALNMALTIGGASVTVGNVSKVGATTSGTNVANKLDNAVAKTTSNPVTQNVNLSAGKLDQLNSLVKKAEETKYGTKLVPDSKGGGIWRNDKNQLPDGNYREFDVNPKGKDKRDTERIVIDTNTGAAYYTPDHYETFIKIKDGK
jgi:guanyl-specific ribonuclease Sa